MAETVNIPSNVNLQGSLVATGQVNLTNASSLTLKDGSVDDDAVASGAAIDAEKLQHRYKAGTPFALAIGATVAAREEIIFIASAACTVNGFSAKLNGAATTGTTSFDLKKNGTTVLTGTVDITSTEGTDVQSGTLNGTVTLAADDVLSVELSNASGDGTGPYAWVELDEAAS